MFNLFAVIYKNLFPVSLTSFLCLLLYIFPASAKPQNLKDSRTHLLDRQQNLLKCGLSKEEIKLKPYFKKLSIPKESELEYYGREIRVFQGNCGRDAVPIYLTALVPREIDNHITLEKYPTIFIYLPDANFQEWQGKFIINNQEGREIYSKNVTLKNRDSVISVNISDNRSLPTLELNQEYQWVFTISRNGDDFHVVAGSIIRVEPNSDIKDKLKNASLQELPDIYAANGIWYDALASLAKLRCLYPNDSTWAEQWTLLLKQVNLIKDSRNDWPSDNKEDISKKPLAQCS